VAKALLPQSTAYHGTHQQLREAAAAAGQ